MTASALRLLVVLFTAGGAVGASAQTPQPGPDQTARQASRDEISIDVARIRKLLGQPSARVTIPVDQLKILFAQMQLLKFEDKIEVQAASPLDALLEQVVREAALPPNPWGSVKQVMAIERSAASVLAKAQVAHPANAVKAIGGVLYRRKVAKIRREVEAELEAIKAQQAAAPAESKPPKKQQ